MRVLVTGATGFIGRGIVSALALEGYSVWSLVRDNSVQVPGSNGYLLGDLSSPGLDYYKLLKGFSAVVHLAAITRTTKGNAVVQENSFREINVEATRKLAMAAAQNGVSRFVFMSSIKVNGEATGENGRPEAFRDDDTPHPEDIYGLSKLEAELALRSISRDTGLNIVVVRPPLVYGPGVEGNFLKLMRLVAKGIPLPFGGLNNRRSLVSLHNLADLVSTCITHPAAVNKTIMVSDGEDLSTTQLFQRLANAMNKPIRLFPFPEHILKWGFSMIGQKHIAQRLCGSLQVDIRRTLELLSWKPPIGIDEGLATATSSTPSAVTESK